jgi:hypothetical protein
MVSVAHEEKHLHIGGEEAVADLLRSSSLTGEVLAWRDCLHAGPVPAGLSLEEMSNMRARFVSGSLEGRPYEEVLAKFNERDNLLKDFKRFDEVTLWFGSGLDDQLRMLQILTWFSQRGLGKTLLSLLCIDGYPGVEPFTGMAILSPSQLASLHVQRQPISTDLLELAKRAWDAFCAESPLELSNLAQQELHLLPFLRAAIRRQLEQFPWTRDGLSRTEQQILRAIAGGPATLGSVYRMSQIELEEAPFMTEPPFLHVIKMLCSGRPNLIEFVDGQTLTDEDGPPYDMSIWDRSLQLTDIGRKILGGQADCIRLYGVDRWLGGVRLRGSRAEWRWDGQRRILVALSA